MKNNSIHIDVLDGLRGIAIIMVLLFHIWQLSWMNFNVNIFGRFINLEFIPVTGFMGVELFFFLSGFCLFYPYARHMLEGEKLQTLKQFAYKRAIKIVPSYFLAILLILVFDKLFLSVNFDWSNLNRAFCSIGAHLLFIQNWFYSIKDNINGVFWSLGVEVQFYVIFPLLCWLFRKKPFLIYALMSIAAIAYRYYIQAYQHYGFHFLLNQLPGFLDMFANGMLGAYLLVFLRSRVDNYQKYKPVFTVISGVAFTIMLMMFYQLYMGRYAPDGIQNWQVHNRYFISVIFMILSVSAAFSFEVWNKILANRFLVFMSVISYNLYMWHQFIARELMLRRIPLPATPDPHSDSVWQVKFTIISIIAGITFSTAITYWFERPILKNGIRKYFYWWR